MRTLVGLETGPVHGHSSTGRAGRRSRATRSSVANSRAFGGGFFIAPDAELDDGLFDVVMAREGGKLRFLTGMPEASQGHPRRAGGGSRCCAAAEMEVTADRDFAVYADGEHLADLPAKLRVLPGALTVIAPPVRWAGPTTWTHSAGSLEEVVASDGRLGGAEQPH